MNERPLVAVAHSRAAVPVSARSGRSEHFAVLTFRADQQKFAPNNRLEATAEESKTLLSGTLAHYGTYTVADNVLVFHIERSTFPNWDGIEQKRPFTLKGDELTYTTPGSTGAGATQIIWRRTG